MKRSDALTQAKQGNPQAIALLLNHSLRAKGIRATVRQKAGKLYVLLESEETPSKATYVGLVQRGLQKLGVQSVAEVYIYGRAAGTQAFAWQTVVSLQADEPASVVSDSQARLESSDRSIKTTQPLPPSWGFWCGWLVMSLVGSAIAFIAMYYFESRIERSYGTAKTIVSLLTFVSGGCIGLFVGLGQWSVLRREAPWSNLWIIRTTIGAFISTTIGTFFGWYYNAEPNFPNAVLFWLLMVLPIVAFQWVLLRQKLEKALLWLVIPTASCTIIGLMLDLVLPEPLNLLDAAIVTRWLLYAIGGRLMIWLLRNNGASDSAIPQMNDSASRQTAQWRSRFNGWFVLEWIGLTLLGWLIGHWLIEILPLDSVILAIGRGLLRIVRLPSALAAFAYSIIVDLPNVLALVIWMGVISGCQWIALRRRLDGAIAWINKTLLGASIGGLAVLVIKASLVFAQNQEIPGNAIIEPWQIPRLFELSLPGLVMVTIWAASVLAQLRFWQRRQFPVTEWMVANIGVFVFVALFPVLQDDFHLLGVTPVIGLALPAMAIASMAAYPSSQSA